MAILDLFGRAKSLYALAASAVSATPAMLSHGYFGPHSSPNFVAHDKRRSKKVRNRARHRLAMKRRGR